MHVRTQKLGNEASYRSRNPDHHFRVGSYDIRYIFDVYGLHFEIGTRFVLSVRVADTCDVACTLPDLPRFGEVSASLTFSRREIQLE